MIRKFLKMQPWAANPPLAWREAPTRHSAGCSVANVQLPVELAEEVTKALEEINDKQWEGHERRGITNKTFLYTAVYWWVTYVYPQSQARH
jgi:hypothetical protein